MNPEKGVERESLAVLEHRIVRNPEKGVERTHLWPEGRHSDLQNPEKGVERKSLVCFPEMFGA